MQEQEKLLHLFAMSQNSLSSSLGNDGDKF